MADPLAERCLYCGSREVLDDAWWCNASECWQKANEPAEFGRVTRAADECGHVDTYALLLEDRDRLAMAIGDLLGRLSSRLPSEWVQHVLADLGHVVSRQERTDG